MPVTLIENGMPVIIIRTADLDRTGHETPGELEADDVLKARVEAIRLEAGHLLNLGDVTDASVPKIYLIAPSEHGGAG